MGITCDPAPSLAAWARELGGVAYPLCADFWPHGEVSRKYGVFMEERGVARRSVFVIDEQGIVRYIDVHQRGELPDEEEVLEALAAM